MEAWLAPSPRLALALSGRLAMCLRLVNAQKKVNWSVLDLKTGEPKRPTGEEETTGSSRNHASVLAHSFTVVMVT